MRFLNNDVTCVNISHPPKIRSLPGKDVHIPQVRDAGEWVGRRITTKTFYITEVIVKRFGDEVGKDDQERDLKDFCRKHVERLDGLGELTFEFDSCCRVRVTFISPSIPLSKDVDPMVPHMSCLPQARLEQDWSGQVPG